MEMFEVYNAHKQKLQGYIWQPTAPKAVLLLAHGLGEHLGRYEVFAQYFVAQGYAVLGADRVGHGRSDGKRGHAKQFQDLVDEITLLHLHALKKFSGLPIALYGHSFGGLLTLHYAKEVRHPLQAIVVSAPAVQLAFQPPKPLLWLGKLMRFIYPSFQNKNTLDVHQLSRTKSVATDYVNDPLVHDKITARIGIDMLEWGKQLLEERTQVDIPMLLMHGTADSITSAQGTQQLSAFWTGPIRYQAWEGFYHELHNEPEQEEVFAFVHAYLREQM